MELLLHMCCTPCSIYSVRHLRELGYNLHGYFYNPNIHPYKEFQRRLETLEAYCLTENISLTVEKRYDLELYLQEVMHNLIERCRQCYRLRLDEAARLAAELEIPKFATTLSISPYQNHDLLQQEGIKAAKRYGVKYVYVDLRGGYRKSLDISKNLGIYRQGYCGCIFSEKERYYREEK